MNPLPLSIEAFVDVPTGSTSGRSAGFAVRSSMARVPHAAKAIVSEQVTLSRSETALSQASTTTSLAVDPARPAVRRVPALAVGRTSLPREALSITINLLES